MTSSAEGILPVPGPQHAVRSSTELVQAVVKSSPGSMPESRAMATMRPSGFEVHVEQSIYAMDAARSIPLKGSGTITVEFDAVSPGVWRCFTDPRVFVVDVLMMASVFGTCITAPLAFIWGGSWEDPLYIPLGFTLLLADAVEDIVYAVYLLMILRISYLHHIRRVEVANSRRILRHHFKNPMYWLMVVGTTAHIWTYFFRCSMLINNIKIFRAVRHLMFLPDSLAHLKQMLWIRLLTPVLLLVLASHWVACLLSALGGYRAKIEAQGFEHFTTVFDGHSISGSFSVYLMAFVESIYMLTAGLDNPLGEGDSVRKNEFGSLLLVAIFGPVGSVVVALFISAIVREQALLFALEIRHAENKAFMIRALQNFDIPPDLQTRVLSLHEYQKMGFDREAFDILFSKNNLSPPLDLALRVYVYHDSALKNSPYLRGKDANYILDIISGFEDRIYLPNDYVIRRGQVGDGMFFLIRGEVSILVPDPNWTGHRSPDHTIEVSTKGQGDYFGEIALIRDCVRTAWVRANNYVLVSLLTRAHAQSIWKHFPQEREELVEQVTKLAREDRERATGQLQGATKIATGTPASQALLDAAFPDAVADDGPSEQKAFDPFMAFLTAQANENRSIAGTQRQNLLMLQAQMDAMEKRQVAFESRVMRSLDSLAKAMDRMSSDVMSEPRSTTPSMKVRGRRVMSEVQRRALNPADLE